MQRYSVYLLVCAFLLIWANYPSLTLSGVLWFGAGISAAFGLLCAIAVVVLNGQAWNFDRLREELTAGARTSQEMGEPRERAFPSDVSVDVTDETGG